MDEWWLVSNDSVESSVQSPDAAAPGEEKGSTGALYWMEDDRWLMCRVEKTGDMLRADIRKTLKSGPPMMMHFEPFTLPVGMHRGEPHKKKKKTRRGPEPPVEPFPLEEIPAEVIHAMLDNFWDPSDENRAAIVNLSQSSKYLYGIVWSFIGRLSTLKNWWFNLFEMEAPRALLELHASSPIGSEWIWYKYYLTTWKRLNSTIESLDRMKKTMNGIERFFLKKEQYMEAADEPTLLAEEQAIRLTIQKRFNNMAPRIETTLTTHGFTDHNDITYNVKFIDVDAKVTARARIWHPATRIIVSIKTLPLKSCQFEHFRIIPWNIMIPQLSLLYFPHLIPNNPWRRSFIPTKIMIRMLDSAPSSPIHPMEINGTIQFQPDILEDPSGDNAVVSLKWARIDKSVWNGLASLELKRFRCTDVMMDPGDLNDVIVDASEFTLIYLIDAPKTRLIKLNAPSASTIMISQIRGNLEKGPKTVIETIDLEWFKDEIEEFQTLRDQLSVVGMGEQRNAVVIEIQKRAAKLQRIEPFIIFNNVCMKAAALTSLADILEDWQKEITAAWPRNDNPDWDINPAWFSETYISIWTLYDGIIYSFTVTPYVSKGDEETAKSETIVQEGAAKQIRDIVAKMPQEMKD